LRQEIPENPSPAFDGAVWSIADTVTADLGFSLSCSFGFCNDGLTNHYFQVYQGPSLASTATRARVWLGDGSTGCVPTGGEVVTVTLYTLINTATPYNVSAANRTLLGSSAPTPLDPAFAGEKFSIYFPAGLAVPANSKILMQVTIQNGPYILADAPGDGTITWLGSVDCGFPPIILLRMQALVLPIMTNSCSYTCMLKVLHLTTIAGILLWISQIHRMVIRVKTCKLPVIGL
jgi:hypothetical protein